MTTVSIQSTGFPAKVITLEKLLDYREEKRDEVPRKTVLGKEPPTTEVDAYLDYPLTFFLEARLTLAERTLLYDIDDDGELVFLRFDGVAAYRCWIEKINISYRNEESLISPWRTAIYMVMICTAEGFDYIFDFELDT